MWTVQSQFQLHSVLIIGFGHGESSQKNSEPVTDEAQASMSCGVILHNVLILGFTQYRLISCCATNALTTTTKRAAEPTSSSSDDDVGASDSVPTALTTTTEPTSSSSDDEVGAGGSSSKKTKQKKNDACKKTTGKVMPEPRVSHSGFGKQFDGSLAFSRLTPTDAMWPKDVPDTFDSCEKDWRVDNILREVTHQGDAGITTSIEAALNIRAKREGTIRSPNLSAQHLVNNVRKKKGSGAMGSFANVRAFLVNQGLVPESMCEYTGSILQNGCDHGAAPPEAVTRIVDLKRFKQNQITEGEIIRLVAQRPVMIEIEAYKSFTDFRGDGIYDGPKRKDQRVGNHALLLIGYGTTEDGVHYWIVQNSWGTGWGQGGYAKIIRKVSLEPNKPSLIRKLRYAEV